MEEVVRQNITDKQWLANDAWVTLATVSVHENIPSLAGTLGFALRKADIPHLGTFLTHIHPHTLSADPDPFKPELWEAVFGCSLNVTGTEQTSKPCLGSEKIGKWRGLHYSREFIVIQCHMFLSSALCFYFACVFDHQLWGRASMQM